MRHAFWRLCARLWTVWAVLLFRVGRVVVRQIPDGPSNCLVWTLQQQQRSGGRLLFENSRYGGWMHVLWMRPDGQLVEFNPPTKRRQRWPPMLFHGRPYETTRCDRRI